MKVLVTGGAGYIGSHVCLELILKGYEVGILDNFCNSFKSTIDNFQFFLNKDINLYECDLRCIQCLQDVFDDFVPDAVIHLAGLKSIELSMKTPIEYYDVNVNGTINLLKTMSDHSCKKLVFSSSATVYGKPTKVPLTESHNLMPNNPYGHSKLIVEKILSDWCKYSSGVGSIALRYFNPIGAHSSGLFGENPKLQSGNLMPEILSVANGQKSSLKVFGDDYDTYDGTCERDFIHVMDVAIAHHKALEALIDFKDFIALNVGTGRSTSVLELIRSFEKVSEKTIHFSIEKRRTGDIPRCWSDPSLAKSFLDFQTSFGIMEMCRDIWRWNTKFTMK